MKREAKMADMLEAVHGAVSVTCTTMFEKDLLAEAPIGSVLEAVRGDTPPVKASRLAKRILYEVFQQGTRLPVKTGELAEWITGSTAEPVSALVSHLEGLE